MCMYASVYKKPTKLLTSFQCLSKLGVLCDSKHQHILAQGSTRVPSGAPGRTKWVNHTTLAGAYTPQLARAWASLLRRVAPPTAARPSVRGGREPTSPAVQHFEDAIIAACSDRR